MKYSVQKVSSARGIFVDTKHKIPLVVLKAEYGFILRRVLGKTSDTLELICVNYNKLSETYIWKAIGGSGITEKYCNPDQYYFTEFGNKVAELCTKAAKFTESC